MATGVNVKMGVSGVQQFKQGMKESQAAVKTLDQALKLNEQQLKSTGDAELYLQNKTQILQDQIRKQTDVVKQSEAALNAMRRNGVSETSTAFQQMQANVYKASSDLMRMRTELENVGDAGEDAATGAEELYGSLQDIGRGISWQNVTSGIDKITGALEKAAKKALDVGKAITKEVLGAGSWADDLHTRATYYGLSDEQLQRMEKTSTLVDTSVDTIIDAQKKLRKGLGSADEGVMGAFAALMGQSYDPRATGWENAFWDAGEALMHFSNAEEKEVYAQKLFGRSWNELIPLFETGREEYDKLNESWSVVSEENLKKLQEMDDQYQKLSAEFETFKMTFLASLAEGLTPLMETLTGMMEKFNEYLASPEGQKAMEKLGEAINKMFEDLTNADPEKIIANLSGIFDKIQGGLQWLIDNKQTVVDALKVIVGGFALLKLGGLAANIGKIVQGLGGLSGAGAAGAASSGAASTGSAAAAGAAGSGIGGILNKLTLVAGADAMWRATEGQIRAVSDQFGAATAGMTPKQASDLAYAQALGLTAGQYENWKEQQNVPEGTGHGAFFGEIPEEFNSTMENMTAVAGETAEAVTKSTDATALMTDAIKGFENMPEILRNAVESAVISGMNSVTIVINESAVDAIGQRTMGGGGKNVVALTR